ncbi:transglutaminase domain-containing protein [Planococcus sp. SIMBA_143]
MTSIRKNKVFMGLLYILVFFLLSEWLRPVIELTETGHHRLFLAFVASGLVMAFFDIPWWITGPLKLFYILWFIVYVYTGNLFFTAESIRFVVEQASISLSALFSQDWQATTDVFRTVLFFALLWMAIYLIHYWVSFRLSIFLFYLLTVIFVAVLDTFSPYSGDAAIVRIMVIGLLLAGLLHLARWMERHGAAAKTDKLLVFSIPLLLLLVASTALAFYLPKADPIWPDPVPYITSYSGKGGVGEGGVGRIGYGVDDSQLGGSFVSDDATVFRAEVEEGQYWKVEVKDVYTTKGWELSEEDADEQLYRNGDEVTTDFPPAGEERSSALVDMQLPFPFVLYPYGTASFLMEETLDYRYDPVQQRFDTLQENTAFEPDVYEVFYSEPSYSLTALRETDTEQLSELPPEYDRYLQLPDELPERVGELAEEIAAGSDTVYGQAQAVERYFGTNGFEYSQSDIAIPAEDQDYVDQFLFETQRGYCDNFSTSMVVLLRSLDIPARWVKGFNEGEVIDTVDGYDVYEVTNNNAHSWVEAYMPGVGWMMFEPTIGFTGSSSIDFDLEIDASEPEEEEMPDRPEPEPEAQPEQPDGDAGTNASPTVGERFLAFVSEQAGKLIAATIVLLLLAFMLFKIRKKWMPKVLIPYYRRKVGDAETFEKAYLRLLKQLELYGIKRAPGQTLRSYAEYVDSFFGTKEMTKLTAAYEKSVYGGDAESVDWPKLKESWENLINRTSG